MNEILRKLIKANVDKWCSVNKLQVIIEVQVNIVDLTKKRVWDVLHIIFSFFPYSISKLIWPFATVFTMSHFTFIKPMRTI